MQVPLKRYWKDADHSYTLGVFPTIEMLENIPEHALGVILHSEGSANQGVKIIRGLCRAANLEVLENDRLVEKLSKRGNTYAVGVFKKYQGKLDHQENHLVLVHPSGMGNLGTILRTMLGFEHHSLALIEPAADIFNPRVIRASMGAIFQVQFQSFETFSDYWGTYAGHTLYPLMTDGEKRLDRVQFRTPYAVILGEESSGLDESFHQYGTSLRIPQSSAVDSLNIALSAGICLYQTYLNVHNEAN